MKRKVQLLLGMLLQGFRSRVQPAGWDSGPSFDCLCVLSLWKKKYVRESNSSHTFFFLARHFSSHGARGRCVPVNRPERAVVYVLPLRALLELYPFLSNIGI